LSTNLLSICFRLNHFTHFCFRFKKAKWKIEK
jgi:hypothetical protein